MKIFFTSKRQKEFFITLISAFLLHAGTEFWGSVQYRYFASGSGIKKILIQSKHSDPTEPVSPLTQLNAQLHNRATKYEYMFFYLLGNTCSYFMP